MHSVHPVGVDLAHWVEGFRHWGVDGCRVEATVSVKQGHTITRGGRVIVGELGHRQQTDPVLLFLADKRSEVGLDCLVESFHLAVSLWVERC